MLGSLAAMADEFDAPDDDVEETVNPVSDASELLSQPASSTPARQPALEQWGCAAAA